MRFTETHLPGAYLIEPERRVDERGHFARVWCEREFAEHGLSTQLVQVNIGFSARQATLRGMHFQTAPHAEVKLVRCTRGAVYDVMVDLRPDSPTHCQWFAAELTPDNGKMLYIPEGFGHGYITLADDTEISYQTSHTYQADAATGVAYDDPVFGIDWPMKPAVMSDADRAWARYTSKKAE
ncbi:MAG: dTDP-4-dehydrorhamnose 3,5-epimerase [Phycisphaerales bacterium JB063]